MAIRKRREFLRSSLLTAFFLLTPGKSVTEEPQSELRHGTIIVWEITTERIIIVSDSGLSHLSAGTVERVGTTACKISNLAGETVFFYTGNLADAINKRTGAEIFSQHAIAREAYRRIYKELRSYRRLVAIGNEYAELARPRMDELLKSSSMASQRVGLAGFVSLDEGSGPG